MASFIFTSLFPSALIPICILSKRQLLLLFSSQKNFFMFLCETLISAQQQLDRNTNILLAKVEQPFQPLLNNFPVVVHTDALLSLPLVYMSVKYEFPQGHRQRPKPARLEIQPHLEWQTPQTSDQRVQANLANYHCVTASHSSYWSCALCQLLHTARFSRCLWNRHGTNLYIGVYTQELKCKTCTNSWRTDADSREPEKRHRVCMNTVCFINITSFLGRTNKMLMVFLSILSTLGQNFGPDCSASWVKSI